MFRGFSIAAVSFACLSSCLPQGDIIDPANGGNVPSLGLYVGAASLEIDTAFLKRYVYLQEPKVALVWQFIGPKEFTYDATDGVVKQAVLPFDFSIDVRKPPGKEILDAPDLALASFWLYHDGNKNGKLDCLLHPELFDMNKNVDGLYAVYQEAVEKVLEVSEVKAVRVPVEETYYIGKYGTTVRKNGDKLDTLWKGTEQGIAGLKEPWIDLLNNRFRILNHANRWERFFALRKRANDYYRTAKPVEGFAMAYDFPYQRKLFPLPGMEEEFEKRVDDATWKLAYFSLSYIFMFQDAVERRWNNYPYDHQKTDCPDWVAGRSTQHALLYFRDRAALDELLTAERGSSFSVTGKEKLHPGYNLVRCGGNYDCEVLNTSAPVVIKLGTVEEDFNPPNTPLVMPVASPKEAPVSFNHLKRLPGAYTYQPFHPFCLSVEQGNLWVSIPDQGSFRLMPADSLNFFTPASDLQIQIVGTSDRPEKLLLYSAGNRYVAVLDTTKEIPEATKARLSALATRSRISVASGVLKPFEGGYAFGKDTLKVSASPGGDSLMVWMPGLAPHWFYAASESVFFSPFSDRSITFRRNDKGVVTDLEAVVRDSSVWAPAVGYVARSPEALFPAAPADPDSQVSASEGTHKDKYVGTDGKAHYPGSADGRFVGAGDGWVATLDRGLPGDSVSLANGAGGVLFKAEGLKGLSAGLDLLLRRDVRAGAARARFRLRGGEDPAHLDHVLSDDFWVTFTADSARVTAKAWPVPADPYYIRLERVRTADAAPAIAVDSYRVLSSRGAHADP